MNVSAILRQTTDGIDKSRANVSLIFSEEPELTGGPVSAAEVFINDRTYGFIYPGEIVSYRVAPHRKGRQPTVFKLVPMQADHTVDESYEPVEIAHVFAKGQLYRQRLRFVPTK